MSLHYAKSASGVATITLDNPPVNVFTPALHRRLYEILQDFLCDAQMRVGIFTAAGNRIMSAGDDVKTPRPERTPRQVIERHLSPRHQHEPLEYPGWENEVMKLERFKPIVAAVNGPVIGGGLLYLLMHTDIRVAVPSASFSFPEIRYGMGGAGGMTQLGRQLPHAIAMSMVLTGEPLDAETALRFGLINEVVPPERLMVRATQIAETIAGHPPIAVRTEMEASWRSMDMSRSQAVAFCTHLYRLQRAAQNQELPLANHPGRNTGASDG